MINKLYIGVDGEEFVRVLKKHTKKKMILIEEGRSLKSIRQNIAFITRLQQFVVGK